MSLPEKICITHPSADAHLIIYPRSTLPYLELFHSNRSVIKLELPHIPTVYDNQKQILNFPNHALTLNTNEHTFVVTLSSPTDDCTLCVPIEHDWYGLGELMVQHWPLQKGMLPIGPLYPFDNGPTGLCTAVEGTLFSNAPVGLHVNGTCLHLGMNAPSMKNTYEWGVGVANFDRKLLPEPLDGSEDKKITLTAMPSYRRKDVVHPWMLAGNQENTSLRLELWTDSNMRSVIDRHLEMLAIRHKPEKPPSIYMMEKPIWSTWAKFKAEVTQNDVVEYAKDIKSRDMPGSVMGIDDRWSIQYGDLEFDRTKFPNPKLMVEQLHDLNFKATLWVTPFASLKSQAVLEYPDFFVKSAKPGMEEKVGTVKWWQPVPAAALDLTNPDAVSWFCRKLDRLQTEYGIDGFKFDAGEPCFIPEFAKFFKSMSAPQEYTSLWIQKVASRYPVCEVRSATAGCQSMTPLLRLFDKFSTWGIENGLQSVVSAVLTLSILGYQFVIPDYIGGNAYDEEYPTAALKIRWMQLCSALPSLQFSIVPWEFGPECEMLCKRALKWREKYFWPVIHPLLKEARENYIPIVRPMFWAAPCAFVEDICDQFMLGDNVVVAPILTERLDRRVFLPDGMWKRVNLDKATVADVEFAQGWHEISGEQDDMPVFERVQE